MIDYQNIGKYCIYAKYSSGTIDDFVLGQIIGFYEDNSETYYVLSIGSSGECIKIYDDSKIQLISTGGGGGGSSTDSDAVHYTADSNKTDAEKAQARTNIGAVSAEDIGTVFTLKGSQPTYDDLLLVQDPQIGDVWYVESVSAGYIWMTSESQPNGYWEELGETIDLSAYELKPTISTSSSSTVQIAAQNNYIYECGTCSSIEVTSFPIDGSFIITFTSGLTATILTVPQTLILPDDFTVEENMRYEINVRNGYGLAAGWAVSSS